MIFLCYRLIGFGGIRYSGRGVVFKAKEKRVITGEDRVGELFFKNWGLDFMERL